ncbi:protein kinase domain-containing protein [Cryptosporidium andersoni]|uniref:Protein kinase domain-containing protein n=1 Tax=Cryptosporidium andersoni TaxID=117008 RepID=A0A1J4MDB1_9CRYT|nr:protein kinase domain-containing protein [Cryptosporidium andersoni]
MLISKESDYIYFLLQISPIVQIHTIKANVRYRIGPKDGKTDTDISYPDPPQNVTSSFDLWVKSEDKEFRLTRKSSNNKIESCKYFYKDSITGTYMPIPSFPDIIVVTSGTKLRIMTSQPTECNIAFVLKSQNMVDIVGYTLKSSKEVLSVEPPSTTAHTLPGVEAISSSCLYKNQCNSPAQNWVSETEKSYLIFSEASLGKGGNGEVFLGLNRRTLEFVAVKCEAPGSLSREAEYLERCKGNFVVKKLDWFQNHIENKEYLVMELLHGGTLRQLLRFRYKDGLPIRTVQQLMHTLILGVDHMHSRGIVHRDLKAANLMFTDLVGNLNVDVYRIKICDLGNSGISLNGRLKGHCCTCFATAPEIYIHNEYDEKVDIWSIGTIFYELLTGHRLIECNHQVNCDATEKILKFNFNEMEDQLRDHMKDQLNGDESRLLDDAIDLMKKLLEKNPSKRISATSCLSHRFFSDYQYLHLDYSLRCVMKLNIAKNTDENITSYCESDENSLFYSYCKCSTCVCCKGHLNHSISRGKLISSYYSGLSTLYSNSNSYTSNMGHIFKLSGYHVLKKNFPISNKCQHIVLQKENEQNFNIQNQ